MSNSRLCHDSDTDTAAAISVIGCALVIVSLLITPLSWVLNGWVLTQLWQWFITPLLGIRAISIPEAIGFSIVVGYLTRRSNCPYKKRSHKEIAIDLMVSILMTFVSPLISLAIGYVTHQFVR